ncbi:MAG: hypothetical protein ABIV51_00720 [Saprospiraceae bacterium]
MKIASNCLSIYHFLLLFALAGPNLLEAQCLSKPLSSPSLSNTSPKDTFVRISTPNLVFQADVQQINSANQIEMSINESPVEFTYSKCKLIAKLHLRIGLGTLRVKLKNEAGSYQQTWYINCGIPDSSALPELDFISPVDEVNAVNDRILRLQATAYNIFRPNQIKITVNGQPYPSFEFKINRNLLKADIYLQRGENTIAITLMNKTGNLTYRRKITLKEDDIKPIIEITQPIPFERLSSKAVMELKAMVRNIRHAEQIRVWINGVESRSFSFDYRDEKVKIQVPSRIGDNGVKIRIQNTAGMAEAVCKFYYDPTLSPKVEPLIGKVMPSYLQATEPDVKSIEELLNIMVIGVDQIEQVEMYLNGAPLLGATYDNIQRLVSVEASLRIGINYFRVVCTNAIGRSEVTYSIECDPVDPPAPLK